MKPRLVVVGLYLLAICIAILLAMSVVFVASPQVADRVAESLGQERLSSLVRLLY